MAEFKMSERTCRAFLTFAYPAFLMRLLLQLDAVKFGIIKSPEIIITGVFCVVRAGFVY